MNKKARRYHVLEKHLSYGALSAFILCLSLIHIHGDSQAYKANIMAYNDQKTPFFEAPLRDTISFNYQGTMKSFTLQELGIEAEAQKAGFLHKVFKKSPDYHYQWREEHSAEKLHEAFAISKPESVNVVWENQDMQVQGGEAREKILIEASLKEALSKAGVTDLKTQTIPAQDKSLALSFEGILEKLVQEGWTVHHQEKSLQLAMQSDDFVWNTHPEGLKPSIKTESMNRLLDQIEAEWGTTREDLRILSVPNPDQTDRIVIEGLPKNGWTLDREATQSHFLKALQSRQNELRAVITEDPAKFINESGLPLPDFKELGHGISNYRGTDSGRIHNVEKAVNEVYRAIFIPSGAEFSFNKLLGPVTLGAGWKNANIIVNGKDLKKAPGGGVCQAASTIFRAALDAGLPIPKQKNHSLYVHYYTQKAVADDRVYDGLDATIYPGLQDLVFTNDTAHPMIMISYTDENRDVHVKLYGAEKDREVSLVGPISASNQDDASIKSIGKLNRSSLAWKQIIEKDGEIVEKWFISRYRGAVKQY